MRSHFIYNLEKIKDKIITIKQHFLSQGVSDVRTLVWTEAALVTLFTMFLNWVKEEQWARPA
jgi:hypothetical protein